jgi:hypothetical protein
MTAESLPRGVKLAARMMFNRLDTDGATYLGFRQYPNLVTFSLTPSATVENLISTDPDNYGAQLDSYAVGQPTTGKVSANRLEHRSSLTALLLGLDSTLTRASAADTASVAMPSAGTFAEIGFAGLSGVTITQPNFNQNGTGDAGVLVYRKSGTPTITYADPVTNDEPLAVSVSGSDITVSLETDGTSTPVSTSAEVVAAINAHSGANVLIGAVLLEDSTGSGVVAAAAQSSMSGGGLLVADTDYTLYPELGMFTSISGGAGLVGLPQDVAFTKDAQAGFTIAGNRVTQVKGKLKLQGKNQVSGRNWLLEADRAMLSPDGDLSLVGGDPFAVGGWNISMEVPSGSLTPYTIKVW